MVDRATFPSTTISTHGIWPNAMARLDELGVLDQLLSKHEVPMNQTRFIGLGHESGGPFTAIGGFDRAMAPRRIALDQAGINAAIAAGAHADFGRRVVGVIGAGTDEDPARGVTLADGSRVTAAWVFGADGRGSVVAKSLGLPKERALRGEMSMAYGYWTGIPNDGFGTFQIELDRVLTNTPVEDDLQMLIVSGPPEMVVGTNAERTRRYLEMVRTFPETLPPGVFERAELITDVAIAPESLMRGFFRPAAGPGWALVGDAGHFKHPGTAQGIGDAVESAVHVAEALSTADGSLDGYQEWRDGRAAEHYEWSFAWGHFPRPENEAIFRGWATEPDAAQDLRDSFSRLVEPSQVMSKERLERWFGAPS